MYKPLFNQRKALRFRQFKRKKGPFILCEFIRSRRLYTFRELVLLGHFFVAPIAFRKRFPKDPRQ